MNQDDLKEMRKDITALIDDIKYQSDTLTDLDRLPVIQLKVILAKINKLTEKSTILIHYIEKEGKLSEKYPDVTAPVEKEKSIADNPAKEVVLKKKENPTEGNMETTSNSDLNKLVVNDIFSAIGINEKYLYASILFKADTALLKNEVEVLNQIEDIKKAKEHLNKLSEKYGWDKENETVINFYTLVERKFDQF